MPHHEDDDAEPTSYRLRESLSVDPIKANSIPKKAVAHQPRDRVKIHVVYFPSIESQIDDPGKNQTFT